MLGTDLDIETTTFWIRLGAAVACGTVIGIERQLRGKASGVRTCILVCLGTEVFVALGASMVPANTDPTRVLGQVITGIGFLGAGVILARDGRVLGVTSAAVIWMLSALGAVIAIGHVATAFVLTLVTLAVLIGVEALETGWTRLRHGDREGKLGNIELE
ncbi:MAG TPA: MgtC/SapB family protein [Gemmatimonadaceae bacterium]|nr:MgtC/SapB family protein [Gemmatimonadaceae bacterium]